MATNYHVGQQVIERIHGHDGAMLHEHQVEIVSLADGVVTTETGGEYDATTGGRIHRTEPYRSIRDLKRKAKAAT